MIILDLLHYPLASFAAHFCAFAMMMKMKMMTTMMKMHVMNRLAFHNLCNFILSKLDRKCTFGLKDDSADDKLSGAPQIASAHQLLLQCH